MTPLFFDPDKEFVEWIKDYANDRVIVDVGCGSGELLFRLYEAGHRRLIGIDAFHPYEIFSPSSYKRIGHVLHFIPAEINSPFATRIVSGLGERALVLLCRPCHSSLFIEEVYNLCYDNNIELLYIGLTSNLQRDLEWYEDKIELPHKGSSQENEVVIKLL